MPWYKRELHLWHGTVLPFWREEGNSIFQLFWANQQRQVGTSLAQSGPQALLATFCRLSEIRSSEIEQPALRRFAKTLKNHREQILAFYDEPITTGPLEGLNNKLKVLKRVAYGYRDMEFFQLRVLFIHEANTKVTGM